MVPLSTQVYKWVLVNVIRRPYAFHGALRTDDGDDVDDDEDNTSTNTITRNKNKLLPVQPLGLYADFTFFWHEAGLMDKTLTDS